ncbi:hypothetical protein RB597_000961 [Gaeumannomyces tritici]
MMVVRCVQVVCCSGALCFGCAPPLGVILLITPRPPPSYISTGAHTTAPAHVPTLSPLPSRFPHTANNSFKNNSTPVRLLSIDYSSSDIVSVKFLSPNSPSTPAKMPPKKTESTKPEGAAAPKAKSTSSHPSYQAMITDAIINLKDRNGSSRQSLKKKAAACLLAVTAPFACVSMPLTRSLSGPSGGTKLAKKVPAPKKEKKEPKEKKAAAPKKPVAEKALTKTKTGRVTKAAAAAKPAAKKATPVKKAATTKKSSAKKAAAEPAAAA